MTFPSTLNQLPDGTQAAFDLIADFDQCFLGGFANLDARHQEILNSFQRIFTGTPLQEPLSDTCAAVFRHEFVEGYFAVLAAVRAALQGSVFDSLQQQVRSALGRIDVAEMIAESDRNEPPAHVQVWLESVRHWLMEIALVGYARLSASTLVPFLSTLEQMQAEPFLMGQAALLTGFFNELMSQVPVTDSSTIPLYRWVDLWTQAMVGAMRLPVSHTPQLVSGTLELLGLDLRHHANLVSFTAYGLLTNNGAIQLTRITLSAYKVDAISGDEIWLLFPHADLLLNALAENRAIELNDVPLLPTGDLLWNGEGKEGNRYDLMKKAAFFFSPNASKIPISCLISPINRHPVQLAEPIFLKDYGMTQDKGKLTLRLGNAGLLPIATERMNPLSELTEKAIANSSQLFGLLRFDAGRWAVQPLALTVQGKTIFTGQKAVYLLKSPPKTSTVAILQERASRLLRKQC